MRTALFLAHLLQEPVRIRNIRAGRVDPGLKPQHASLLRLLRSMTACRVEGGEVGSRDLTFHPGPARPGTYALDIGTAGCIPLVLQAVLPVAVATQGTTRFELTGGTHVPFGPTTDWLETAYLPYLARLASVRIHVERVGFYPEGGGRVVVEVTQDHAMPHTVDGLRALVRERLGARRIEQGRVVATGIRSVAAHVAADVPRRQAFAALAHMTAFGRTPAVVEGAVQAQGPGSAVTCWLEDEHGNRLASDRLGHRGTSAESVGKFAAANLVEDWQSGATVDRHLADHLAPWVALGAGAVRVPQETSHLRTNAWVCNEFLGYGSVRTDRGLLR